MPELSKKAEACQIMGGMLYVLNTTPVPLAQDRNVTSSTYYRISLTQYVWYWVGTIVGTT